MFLGRLQVNLRLKSRFQRVENTQILYFEKANAKVKISLICKYRFENITKGLSYSSNRPTEMCSWII